MTPVVETVPLTKIILLVAVVLGILAVFAVGVGLILYFALRKKKPVTAAPLATATPPKI